MSDYENENQGGGHGGGSGRGRPLHTEKIMTERKTFFLDLKENDRGRFIKITEDVRGRRDTIMVPIEVLNEFMDALENIVDADEKLGGGSGSSED